MVCNHALIAGSVARAPRDFKSVEHYVMPVLWLSSPGLLLWDAAASTKPGQGTYMGCSLHALDANLVLCPWLAQEQPTSDVQWAPY
jgi:hypothetical protein